MLPSQSLPLLYPHLAHIPVFLCSLLVKLASMISLPLFLLDLMKSKVACGFSVTVFPINGPLE